MSTSGLSTGNYTLLNVLKDGAMQDVVELIGAGSAGAVSTASAPLSINAGDISLDASGLATTADLANKIDTLTAIAPLSVSGIGTSRFFSTLFSPSSCTFGTGLFGVSNDNLGTLDVTLTGLESRTESRIADSNGTVRELTCEILAVCQNHMWQVI